MRYNNALQQDKDKLSRLVRSQKSRQLAFAAEPGRYTAGNRDCRTREDHKL